MFPCVRLLWLFLHVLIFVTQGYSDTDVKLQYKAGNNGPLIHASILFVITVIAYSLACRCPGFVDEAELPIRQHGTTTNYCDQCNMSRPLRALHCRYCRRCVLRRDHHCPWLGTCVGQRNHLYFILYLISDGIFFSFMLGQFWGLTHWPSDMNKFVRESLPNLCMVIMSIYTCVYTLVLVPFHIYMMTLNYTTGEVMRGKKNVYMKRWKRSYSPFSKGLCQNLGEFLTMANRNIEYKIPETEEEINEWQRNNCFFVNDYYDCCC